MGRKKSMVLSCTALFLIFMLTTVFFYLVYNRFYDSISDDFTGFFLYQAPNETDTTGDERFASFTKDLIAWAKEHHAILFFRGGSAAGIATVDYAGWFRENWDVSFDGTIPKTAIVTEEDESIRSYVHGDVLFPGTYDYKIIGKIGTRNIPTFQRNAFFYYPLCDSADSGGVLFTDQKDRDALRSLEDVLYEHRGRVDYQTYMDRQLSIIEAFYQMLFEDFLSRSFIFAFLGLFFCAVFAILMMYRESNRYLEIHHLFGATYQLLYFKFLIPLIAVAVLGTFVGYLLACTQLHLFHASAYRRIAAISLFCHIIFLLCVQMIVFFHRKREAKRNGVM